MFKRLFVLAAIVLMAVVTVHGAFAAVGTDFADPCYEGQYLAVMVVLENATIIPTGETAQLKVTNTCQSSNSVEWPENLNLSILGNVTDGEVIIGKDWVYVDTTLRPDLDNGAIITFKNVPFVTAPRVLRNGVDCGGLCNVTYDRELGEIIVQVVGFSNYSLQHAQDFVVHSDYEPELKPKMYQTIDLGDARRNEEYACVVQIYGLNQRNEYVLVQTNPKREVQAKLLGNPDTNQPESLGYFPTKNGMANVYFTNDKLAGYVDLLYVAQCASNSTSLVYEEAISTRYSPVDRSIIGRGVWLSDGSNAFYVTVWIVGGLLVGFVVVMVWNRAFRYRL